MEEMRSLADATKAEKWRSRIPSGPPTLVEVRAAIKSLKLGRAAGSEGLRAEALKLGRDVIAPALHRQLEAVWAHDHIPAEWARTDLLPILKQGKQPEQNNSYRPISLGSTVGKVLMTIMLRRLTPMIEDTVGDYQHGFRQSRSTTDAIFTYRILCDRFRQKRDGTLHACFIDLTQAFDRISWELLWHALHISGAPDKLVRIIRLLYETSEIHLRTDASEQPQAPFHPTTGVRQGCILSPSLFILTFEYVIRAAMEGIRRYPECTNWPALGGALLALLGYADDIVLIATKMKGLQDRMAALERTCTRAGMLVSAKTKLQHVNAPPDAVHPPLALQTFTVEAVPTFTYLGSEVTPGQDTTATVQDRLTKAAAAFSRLGPIWNTRSLPKRTKALMYNTLVRPIAIYGAETWVLTAGLEDMVDVADMGWIRRIAGISLRREMTNDAIRRIAHCPVKLSEACRQGRLRYFGHVCRMDPTRAPHWALHHEAPGTSKQGRPHLSWIQLLHQDAASRGLSIPDLRQLAPNQAAYRSRVVYGERTDGLATCPEPYTRPNKAGTSPSPRPPQGPHVEDPQALRSASMPGASPAHPPAGTLPAPGPRGH
jgi:hypothetical protein